MRVSRWMTTSLGLGAAAVLGGFVACADAPTESRAATRGSGVTASAKVDGTPKPKKATVQFARVKSDGTLVDGTAISAERFGEGIYLVKFAPGIGGCAGAANSAFFPGADLAVYRIAAQLGIGYGSGGAFDDETVTVNLFSTLDDSGEDTSFTLTLVCP